MKLQILVPTALLLIQLGGNRGPQTPKFNLEGVVIRAGSGEIVPGARVTLTRTSVSPNAATFLADATGRFAIPAVTPGDYRLVAWEFLEPFAFFDPRLIQQADEAGMKIHIAESSRQTLDVKALPTTGN